MPRKKKKIYKNIVLKNVKTLEDLPENIAIRIERGVGGRRTLRYVNETICTPTEKNDGKPWGYITVAKPNEEYEGCLLYTSPSPRDLSTSRMPSSA